MIRESRRIGNTPLSISVYSVENAPTKIHDKGILEIIFCLKGSVRFSYAYEEFTLHEGEYISVDRDAYYLYDGRDNICVSLYFDLAGYKDKYPFIENSLFVCEGVADADVRYAADAHSRLRGTMIALLRCVLSGDEAAASRAAERIIDLFVGSFDIFFYHVNAGEKMVSVDDSRALAKNHEINDYIHNHIREKITIGDLARHLNFTEGYMSEYMRKTSIGFRNMLGYTRANVSEHYLLKTDKTILEISEECGFSDVKYYYAAFKRWYRCTPKQFRDKYGKTSDERVTYMELSDVGELLDRLMEKHYMEMYLL